MKIHALKKTIILLSSVMFLCIAPIQFSMADYEPNPYEEFPEEEDSGSSPRQLCYTHEQKECSNNTTYSGGVNAQLKPTPGAGINGNYNNNVTYWYFCKRGTGGNMSECQSQSCNGSFGPFLRCPKL